MNECRIGRAAAPRRRLARRAAAGLAAASAGLALSACGASPTTLDQSFVETVRSAGRDVPPGADGEGLLQAARKICDRKLNHDTVAERRASALTPEDIDAVERTFAHDARQFTNLALETYCPD